MTLFVDKRPILIVSGGGAQNIGNAFFNVGGLHIVRRMFPDRNVQLIQDQPGYWTFNRSRTNPNNYCELLGKLDIDFIVLQGPVFSSTLPKLWDQTLQRLYQNGTRVIYLSSAFFKYTDEEISTTKRFLEKFPPAVISTRDSESYFHLKNSCEHVYDGICSAWFVPDVYRPASLTGNPYITLNFDRMPEPNIAVGQRIETEMDASKKLECLEMTWWLSAPRVQQYFSELGKAWAYIGAIADRRKLPQKIGDYDVIRPEHRTNPHFGWKIYGQSGGIASDEPFTYFTVYANTKLTLSDRVHACVMTLAYGNPAMLFSSSPRSKLFDRMQLGEIRKKPVTLDPKILEAEKSRELKFLRETASRLII